MQLIDSTLLPPEPQLLDTCVLQNIDWVDRQLVKNNSIFWDDKAVGELASRYGTDHADDLIALGSLYKAFEYRGGYPWLVCAKNFSEAEPAMGERGDRLRDVIRFFQGHQDDLSVHSYPKVSIGLLSLAKPSVHPLILRSMNVSDFSQLSEDTGPLRFLKDDGDRFIAATAIASNVPAILTTDKKSFWAKRLELEKFGAEIIRPRELLEKYELYWAACEHEFERRRLEE